MMLHIPGVLSPEQVAQMRARLAATDWIDGRASVGPQGAQVKRNRQLAEGSPLAVELGQIVSAALMAHPLFFSSVLPLRILAPYFNSYGGGEHYGLHVDGAIRAQRPGLPAIALALDSSAMTACANDYSFEAYFARMTRALGRPGDVLIGITTSGRSPNVLRALDAAREMGMVTIGLLGGDGGPALPRCDLALVVPDRETGRVQESHITAGHAIMELIEEILLARGVIARSGAETTPA